MTLEEWERIVPEAMRLDPLWKMSAYRKALYVADVGWQDVTKLVQDRRTLALSDQLCRSLGSISANLAEGYSRGTGSDRARFYEYALGSARESADWYFKARHILGDAVVEEPHSTGRRDHSSTARYHPSAAHPRYARRSEDVSGRPRWRSA